MRPSTGRGLVMSDFCTIKSLLSPSFLRMFAANSLLAQLYTRCAASIAPLSGECSGVSAIYPHLDAGETAADAGAGTVRVGLSLPGANSKARSGKRLPNQRRSTGLGLLRASTGINAKGSQGYQPPSTRNGRITGPKCVFSWRQFALREYFHELSCRAKDLKRAR